MIRHPRPSITLTVAVTLATALLLTGCVGGSGGGASSSATSPPTTAGSCAGTGLTIRRDVPYRTQSGVDATLLSLDLYEPQLPDGCGAAPIVVYVHGGGFRRGDKSLKAADKARLFTDEGWVFASVNYELSPEPPNSRPEQVRYPTHEQDVAAALAWLGENADGFGGDPTRILLLGHSSGAFIVSLLSTDTDLLADAGVDPTTVRCTVSLDTEYDVISQIDQGGAAEALYRNGIGDDPADWTAASPIHNVEPGRPRPEFLVVARGLPRRVEQAQRFGDALEAGGTPATVLDVSPLTHEEVNAAVGAEGDTAVTPAVMLFYRDCVRTS